MHLFLFKKEVFYGKFMFINIREMKNFVDNKSCEDLLSNWR